METTDTGHGRIEVRRLEAITILAEHRRDVSGLYQVCKIARRRTMIGKDSVETVYAINKVPRRKSSPVISTLGCIVRSRASRAPPARASATCFGTSGLDSVPNTELGNAQ